MSVSVVTAVSPIVVAALALGLVSAEAGSVQPTKFDGAWSVRVLGESGSCNREQTLPLRVVNGVVTYSGWPSPTTNGTVQKTGRLHLEISFMQNVITASGALKDRSGQGMWNSATMACSGHWFAEKL